MRLFLRNLSDGSSHTKTVAEIAHRCHLYVPCPWIISLSFVGPSSARKLQSAISIQEDQRSMAGPDRLSHIIYRQNISKFSSLLILQRNRIPHSFSFVRCTGYGCFIGAKHLFKGLRRWIVGVLSHLLAVFCFLEGDVQRYCTIRFS